MAKKKKEIIDDVKVVEVKEKIVNETKSNLIPTIIMGLVGLILIFLPEESNKLIGYIVAAALLFAGIILLVKYFKNKETTTKLNFISGILYSVLGILIIIFPLSIMRFLTIVLGVYLIVNGSLKMHTAYLNKMLSDNIWISLLVTGLIIIVFGIVIIVNSFSGIVITRLSGIFLFLSSLFDVINNYIIKK